MREDLPWLLIGARRSKKSGVSRAATSSSDISVGHLRRGGGEAWRGGENWAVVTLRERRGGQGEGMLEFNVAGEVRVSS